MLVASKKAMSEAEFCSTVCGGKCCVLHSPEEGEVRCPNLSIENSCTIYAERYADGMPDLVVVGTYKSKVITNMDKTPADRPFFCGRIHQIIARGALSKSIADQCCLVHPELLLGIG